MLRPYPKTGNVGVPNDWIDRQETRHDPRVRRGRHPRARDGHRGGSVPRGAGGPVAGPAGLRHEEAQADREGPGGAREEGGSRDGAAGAAELPGRARFRRTAQGRGDGDRRDLRRGRPREGHGRDQGSGVPGRRAPPSFRRWSRNPREYTAPQARLDRPGYRSVAHHQGKARPRRHGGIVFGPHPRDYRLGIPKKLRQLAKKSALNARAREEALFVVDALEYEKPKTKTLAELLGKLEVAEKKVLVLTAGAASAHNVYLSGRNIPDVHVMRFADAKAYEILWADAVVVELPALEGTESPDKPEGKAAGEGGAADA